MSEEKKIPYNPKTVRFVVFKGTEPVSPEFKTKRQAKAYQLAQGGQVLRVEKGTLRKMARIPTVYIKMSEDF